MKTNIFPPKNIFSQQEIKPGYGPHSNTRVLQPCIVLKCAVIRPVTRQRRGRGAPGKCFAVLWKNVLDIV